MVRGTRRKPQISRLMNEPHPATARRPAIRAWLYIVAALMVLTLVVGGATRLTESGLSIVEWKPVTGVLPPLVAGRVAGGLSDFPEGMTVMARSDYALVSRWPYLKGASLL